MASWLKNHWCGRHTGAGRDENQKKKISFKAFSEDIIRREREVEHPETLEYRHKSQMEVFNILHFINKMSSSL